MAKTASERTLCAEDINIGEEFDPLEITVTEDQVGLLCWGNNDYNPWYLEKSPWGEPIAPPTIIAGMAIRQSFVHYGGATQTGVNPKGGWIWAKQEVEFINPIPIGKKLIMTGHPVESYNKKGRDFLVSEHVVKDEDGKEIFKTRLRGGWPQNVVKR